MDILLVQKSFEQIVRALEVAVLTCKTIYEIITETVYSEHGCALSV